MHHDDGIFVDVCDSFDEVVAGMPCVEVAAVASMPFDGYVAFAGVGGDEDDRYFGVFGSGGALGCCVGGGCGGCGAVFFGAGCEFAGG